MKLNGLELVVFGVIFLAIDSCYFIYYYLTRIGFGNPYRTYSDFSIIVFWNQYFFHSAGGVLLLIAASLIAFGLAILARAKKKCKGNTQQMIDDYLLKIKKENQK